MCDELAVKLFGQFIGEGYNEELHATVGALFTLMVLEAQEREHWEKQIEEQIAALSGAKQVKA